MSKTKTSQSQQETTPNPFTAAFTNPLAGFDPMEAFGRMAQDNMERIQSFYDELAAWEAKSYDRAKAAAEQLADLASESMTYLSTLAAEWRKVGLEATKRSAELFQPKA